MVYQSNMLYFLWRHLEVDGNALLRVQSEVFLCRIIIFSATIFCMPIGVDLHKKKNVTPSQLIKKKELVMLNGGM